MGYRVESYSLNELHRIAVPGTVTPSLFWALPVGNWPQDELDEVWQLFTKQKSECNDYGLLLVKERGRRREKGEISLASVGAKLSDLMPAGAERFDSLPEDGGESPQVLVLSGGYPQPGWGVLVEWRQCINRFEELIGLATAKLRGEESTNKLSLFRDAAQGFHRLRNLRSEEPAKPELTSLANEILEVEKIEILIRDAESALQAGKAALLNQKIITAVQALRQADWIGIEATTLQTLEDLQQTYIRAALILAVPANVVAGEITPNLESLIADPSKRGTFSKNLSSQELKDALGACLHFRGMALVGAGGNFSARAEQTRAELQPRLTIAMSELRQDIEAKLAVHRGVKLQREHEHDIEVRQSRQRSKEAREFFHGAAGKAVELQWEIGPQFLVAFEHFCRKKGLCVRSIPWDPARMVGWKIMASKVRLYSCDLQIAAQELAPDATGDSPTNGQTTTVANGSYFTDYVHHIAIAKPGFSPRTVTRDLLARLLRPAEMIGLIETHTGEAPTATDAPLLAEELLRAFGWRESDDVREKPLAGCIKGSVDTAPTIAGNLSGNDLRIVVESFCKDIVDVVVAQLGYSHADVWTTIEERVPDYRPSSKIKDWDEEVRHMTMGAAVMLLPAFGPLAFPERVNEVTEFAAGLRKLAEVLNRTSHHREGERVSSEAPSEAPALIQQLLGMAEAFLGDLPWHLEANFVYGEQPKVLSGEAWSHGSPRPRLLRVIVWTGESPGTHFTFWNKERRNPVVPDPVFIMRPRRR